VLAASGCASATLREILLSATQQGANDCGVESVTAVLVNGRGRHSDDDRPRWPARSGPGHARGPA